MAGRAHSEPIRKTAPVRPQRHEGQEHTLCRLRTVLDRLGFQCRIKGDHFIYTKDGVEEIINIQPVGNKAKPYQVKQVRNIILKYQLGGDLHEE